MMRFLGISFIAIVILSSCTLSTTKDFVLVEDHLKEYQNPYFSNLSKDYVYKANFEVYGHEFGGLLIIKKLAVQHHKIVFATEFGTKMLDMDLKKDTFTIHFIADDLNKKILISTLKKDFKILLQEEITVKNTYKNTNSNIYESVDGKRLNYFFVDKVNRKLHRIVNTSTSNEKIIFIYESKDGKTAEDILIEHKNIKLKIKLKTIN